MQAEEVVLPASTSSTTLSEQDGGAVEATTTAIEATDSMVAEATAVTETADATASEEAPIEEGIRLHFENVDETAPESQGLWTWGGVAEPSDGNQWPTDTANFSSSQVDDYGHYVDIKNLRHRNDWLSGPQEWGKITESDQKWSYWSLSRMKPGSLVTIACLAMSRSKMKMFSASTTPVKTTIMKVGAFGLGAIRLKRVMAGQQVPLILNLANTELMLTFLYRTV